MSSSKTYDVFLTYHDKDIGKSFASDLYSSFTHAGCLVYINNNNLTSVDHTNSSVLQAIQESRISVIIFSSNFDASTWFLEEMEKILECGRTIGHVVVPVSYDVLLFHLRQQKGVFACLKDKSMRYRAVLFEVTSMSGFCIRGSR